MIAEKWEVCPKCGEGGKRWLYDAQHCEACGYSGIKAAFAPFKVSADRSLSVPDAIDGVMDLFPGADRQALNCLAELLTKR